MSFTHEVTSISPATLLLLVSLGVPAFTVACGGDGSGAETTSSGETSTEQESTDTGESETQNETADTEDPADETTSTEDTSGTESTTDTDETTDATTDDGDGPDLDECLRADLSFDLDQPLYTIDAAQKEELCAWYQSVWQCALDRDAMCVSEGLRVGEQALTDNGDGVAACKDAEQKCLDDGPKALETLQSCLEVDVITTCEGSLADYLLCMRANFAPIEEVQLDQYTCDEVSEYAEQNDREWVVPPECEAFSATCDFDLPE